MVFYLILHFYVIYIFPLNKGVELHFSETKEMRLKPDLENAAKKEYMIRIGGKAKERYWIT